MFRGGAIGLRKTLPAHEPSCPFVHAVVVVWGEYPDGASEVERVAYVAGTQLTNWLRSRPMALSPARRDALARAVQRL